MTYSAVQKTRYEKRKDLIFLRFIDSEVESFDGNIGDFQPETITIEEDTNYAYREIKVNATDSRADKIAAVIESRYSKDDQIAMLANEGDGVPEHEQEIQNFQNFRAFAKALVDNEEV